MLNKLPSRLFIISFLTLLLLSPATGCIMEEETFEMETDQEFQEAVENAVERFLQDDEPAAILNDLYEVYGERYSEEEIEAYVRTRVEEEAEKISGQLKEMEERVIEAENRVNELMEQLKERDGENALENLKENLEPFYNWIEKLDEKIEETADPGRVVDLKEEKINTYNELASIIDDQLGSNRRNINQNSLETRELLNYYHEITALLEKEKDLISAYEGVAGDNFISEQVLHDELRQNVIPASEDLLKDLRRVKPEGEETKTLHDSFIQTWERYLEGFINMARGIRNNEQDKKAEAEQLIEEGTRLREQFLNRMDELF